MGLQRIHLAASGLVFGFLLLTPTGATPDDGSVDAEPFEVIVVRGAGVVRVTGTRSGVIREETLREDTRPTPSAPAAAPPSVDPIVVVVIDGSGGAAAAPSLAYAPFLAQRRHGSHGRGLRPQRHHPHQHLYRADKSSQRFYHARSRGHGHPVAKPHGRQR